MPLHRWLAPVAVLLCFTSVHAQVESARRTGGAMLGVQAWTFSRFTLMEAIEKTAAAGGTNIELFPGQALGKEYPGVRVGPDMGPAATEALHRQLDKFGMNVVAYGVTGIDKDEAGARKLFAWRSRLGSEFSIPNRRSRSIRSTRW